MGQFSLTHILLLGIILLVLFGPTKLPQLGQSIGKAIRGFKEGLSEIDAEVKPIDDNEKEPRQQIHGGHQQAAQNEKQKSSAKDPHQS